MEVEHGTRRHTPLLILRLTLITICRWSGFVDTTKSYDPLMMTTLVAVIGVSTNSIPIVNHLGGTQSPDTLRYPQPSHPLSKPILAKNKFETKIHRFHPLVCDCPPDELVALDLYFPNRYCPFRFSPWLAVAFCSEGRWRRKKIRIESHQINATHHIQRANQKYVNHQDLSLKKLWCLSHFCYRYRWTGR